MGAQYPTELIQRAMIPASYHFAIHVHTLICQIEGRVHAVGKKVRKDSEKRCGTKKGPVSQRRTIRQMIIFFSQTSLKPSVLDSKSKVVNPIILTVSKVRTLNHPASIDPNSHFTTGPCRGTERGGN